MRFSLSSPIRHKTHPQAQCNTKNGVHQALLSTPLIHTVIHTPRHTLCVGVKSTGYEAAGGEDASMRTWAVGMLIVIRPPRTRRGVGLIVIVMQIVM